MMKQVRITALRKVQHDELSAKYDDDTSENHCTAQGATR